MFANFSSASGFKSSSIAARLSVLSSSSSSKLSRLPDEPSPFSSSPSAEGSSSTSSSSLNETPAVFSLISPSSSAPSSSRFSGAGSFDSIASRSTISRSCMSPLFSAVDQSMIALKVSGLSQSPRIIVSRPASMRFAIAISPSRLKSSTAPISRRYMRTGSSVRSTVSFFFSIAGFDTEPVPADTSTSSSTSCSASSCTSSSLSTMLMPMSEIADMMSSICSEDIWSCGSASLSSS